MVFVAGHFGEWVQGLVGDDQGLALVTLPCSPHGVRARIAKAGSFRLAQNHAVLDSERCRFFLGLLGLSSDVQIGLDVDFPPGGGAGMSTAALVAIARGCGANDSEIASACLAVEGATDPLMLDRPGDVLWAPREARVLETLPSPPAAEIVGGFWGPPSQTDPRDLAFPNVDDLVAAWKTGPDLAEAARLASVSCDRTTALRGPKIDPTAELARRLGALGVARAHTGSARSIIFAPGDVPAGAENEMRNAGYTHVLRFRTGGA